MPSKHAAAAIGDHSTCKWKNSEYIVSFQLALFLLLLPSAAYCAQGYAVRSRLCEYICVTKNARLVSLWARLCIEIKVQAQVDALLNPTIHEATLSPVARQHYCSCVLRMKIRMLHSTSCLRIDSPSISKRLVECTMRYFHAQHARTSCCRVAGDKSCLSRSCMVGLTVCTISLYESRAICAFYRTRAC